MSTVTLDKRQVQLLHTFVDAYERSGHVPFDFAPGQRGFSHRCWPADVQVPTDGEVRPLVHLGMLEVDHAVAPVWRVHPSSAARKEFGSDAERQREAALSNPDERLAVILQGTVEAFEADPAEPLLLWPVGEGLVRHSGWPLPADVVRMHDVQQLQDLGLVAAAAREKGIAFWPTPDGRTAIHNGAELLERRSATAGEAEASRLRRWAERLRAGDVAVGLVTGTAPTVIRALLGF